MRESREGGNRFIMGHVNPAAWQTLQHGVWAASQYFNNVPCLVQQESLSQIHLFQINCMHATWDRTIIFIIHTKMGILWPAPASQTLIMNRQPRLCCLRHWSLT